MAELCLVASHGYPPGLVFNQEHGITRLIKDGQLFSPNAGGRQEIAGSRSLSFSPIQSQRWEPVNRLLESNQWTDRTVTNPVILDVQDALPTSEILTFEKSERSTKPEEILQLLVPSLSNGENGQEALAFTSDLVDLQAMTREVLSQPITSSLVYTSCKFDSQQPLLDFVGDLARNSKITIHPDGRVEFTGSKTEMKDLLSIVAEFYLSRNSVKWERHSFLVPNFNRLNREEALIDVHVALKLEAVTVPLKRPEKFKVKTSRKKSSRKVGRERDLYKRNYFHACESLLSLMVDKGQQGKKTVLSLKKAGPELPELLNQFSAGIAGTGIAVLLSVVCRVASGMVPFCASKLLSTGFGFGLVWLSWAVNKLSATVTYISRNGGRLQLKDDEVLERINKSMKEIYFRAATIMVVAVLRLA